MKHSRPLNDHDWWTLAEYFRGGMAHTEQLAFEKHLETCAVCREELEGLSWCMTPAPVQKAADPLVTQRVLALVHQKLQLPPDHRAESGQASPTQQAWKAWSAQPSGLVREDESDWESTGFPGIEVKRLFVEPNRKFVTMRVRMAPGTSYPAHRHGGREQCFVIQGDLRAGERIMRAGDFEVVEEGSEHPVQWTQDGCELLIVSSTNDSFL